MWQYKWDWLGKIIMRVLTGGGSVRKAKREEQKQIFRAILFGVSKHCAGSFPTVGEPFAVSADGQHIWALNLQSCLHRNPLRLSSCLRLEFGLLLHLSSTWTALRLFEVQEQCMFLLNQSRLLARMKKSPFASGDGTVCTFDPPNSINK